MNYRHYTAAEFLTDPSFRSWILDQDPAAEVFWENWMAENPDRREELEEARALLYVLAEKAFQVSAKELDDRVQDMLVRATRSVPRMHPRVRPAFYRYVGIAASICLLTCLGWLGYRFTDRKPGSAGKTEPVTYSAKGNIVRFNRTTKPVTILLEDSSRVTLAPESELTYPEKFAREKREVHLKGEAFFQISHHADRPFLVNTEELVTRVLGTSFTVRSFEKDQKASVSVRTGRVSVYAKGERGARSPDKAMEVILKPNQQVLYDRVESRLVKLIVEAPVRVNEMPAASLVFDEAPVGNVFKTIEREYGVELFFDAERLSDCQLTANLSGLPMYEQLDLICRIIHAKYEVVDGQVIIHGEGCKAD